MNTNAETAEAPAEQSAVVIEPPPANEATVAPSKELPSVSRLQQILKSVPVEDPQNAKSVQYHLNRQRSVVSHSSAELRELELRKDDAMRTRDILIQRNARVVAEIENLDLAIRSIDAGISVLMGAP